MQGRQPETKTETRGNGDDPNFGHRLHQRSIAELYDELSRAEAWDIWRKVPLPLEVKATGTLELRPWQRNQLPLPSSCVAN